MKTNKPFIVSVVVLAIVALIFVFSGMKATQPPIADDQGAVQGKLNINIICEEALAYMSFPDGAAADTFIAECKEGKHPEVIERYKAQMNLGDGALY